MDADPAEAAGTHEYTVGWICALPHELSACRLMLDEEFEEADPVTHANDSNTYCFGRVGQHKVVVACLPKGSYGTNSAATVATNLLASFANIRFGVLVGIGGGVPSSIHDIRLGDVVVSIPEGEQSGVIQYDLGKETVHGFQRTGALNRPPEKLLSATSKLVSNHELGRSRMNEFLHDLPSAFRRPDLPDVLFASDYRHAGGAHCDDCDSDHVVAREHRDHNEPVIHYGVIASANRVIKDAEPRDRLQNEYQILCFEMEAAGLMNTFPCIVVRGICDYCDSHKNKAWQNYATIAAAAWAKELLLTVRPAMVASLDKALAQVQIDVNEVKADIKKARAKLDGLAAHSNMKAIIDWLRAPDVSGSLQAALDKCHPGSGRYFIESAEFRHWRASESSSPLLWLHGKAGCGKTVLSSSIFRYLQDSTTTGQIIAHHYFDFQNGSQRAHSGMMRSLVSQICSGDDVLLADLQHLWNSRHGGNSQPSANELESILERSIARTQHLTILIDALDECEDRALTLAWLLRVLQSNTSGLYLILTSRDEKDIRLTISGLEKKQMSFSVDDGANNAEIQKYVRARLYEGDEFRIWHGREVLGSIESTLMDLADGMYRWVACQLDALQQCKLLADLENTIQTLPKTLDETYDRMFAKVDDINRPRVTNVLQIMLVQSESIFLEDAVEIFAIDSNEGIFDPSDCLSGAEELVAVFSGLLSLSPIDHTWGPLLCFPHFSVMEYLQSGRIAGSLASSFTEVGIQTGVSRICCAYLQSYVDATLKIGLHRARDTHPWISRAASIWLSNTSEADMLDENTAQSNYTLLDTPSFVDCLVKTCHLDLADSTYDILDFTDVGTQRGSWCPSGITLAASAGFARTFKRLVVESDSTGSQQCLCCSLSLSAIFARIPLIDILLEHGVGIDARPQHWQGSFIGQSTALLNASMAFKSKVVHFLLERGADPNARTTDTNLTPLMAIVNPACNRDDRREMMDLLFHYGADVNMSSAEGDTALSLAATENDERSVKKLLYRGAEVNGPSTQDGSLLQRALQHRLISASTVLILLEAGADPNAQCSVRWRSLPLSIASGRNQLEIVKLLLKYGAATDAVDHIGKTALQNAAESGFLELMELLIEHGSDVNQKSGYHGTALHAACCYRSWPAVKFLLSRGADVNARAGQYRTALQTAIIGSSDLRTERGRWLKVVKALLDAGADANICSGPGGGALPVEEGALGAAIRLYERSVNYPPDIEELGAIVKLLMDHDSVIVGKDKKNQKLLKDICRGRERMTRASVASDASSDFSGGNNQRRDSSVEVVIGDW